MISDIFRYEFLQNAVIGGLLASIVCGIIGAIIVEKRLVMMSGGVAHTSFGGIGLGYYLGFEPIVGGLLFAIGAGVGIVYIKRHTNTKSDTLIGMFWSVGMALGILFISLAEGYPPDMTSYLFGNILTVTKFDISIISILCLVIAFSIIVMFNYWKAYLFDEEFLQVLRVNTVLLEYFLFILIAFTIVVLIKVVGIILVIALLTIPPAIAKFFCQDLSLMMVIGIIAGGICTMIGLSVSYYMNISSGASIIITLGIAYMCTALFSRMKSGK